ncbi:hypothetical protein NEDG_00298 [Nematocida displodere]|uniref:Uncharacterized protein n=1 Tax=Nematocida displodere TaxID=1805483 RepID=A0A177EIM8_9MICR|nr:hypothetical protein NEDG_00298 [Nematocida displodere]
MNYLLATTTPDELRGRMVLVNEYLGASADALLSEFLSHYKKHALISYYKRAEEYPTATAVSLLSEGLEKEVEEALANPGDLLIIDGWNLQSRDLPPPAQATVLLINRSVTKPEYASMYQAFAVISLKQLKTQALRFTGSACIQIREKSVEVELLFREGTGTYTPTQTPPASAAT